VNQLLLPLSDNVRYVSCVSFANVSDRKVTSVRFDFNLLGPSNDSQARFQVDRVGEFSPGVTITGPTSQLEYNVGVYGAAGGNQKLRNCWSSNPNGTPQNMEVVVIRAIFADGTQWAP
jgi:hypothetical protein